MFKKYNISKSLTILSILIATITTGFEFKNSSISASLTKNAAVKKVENISHNKGLYGGNELSKNSMYKETLVSDNVQDSVDPDVAKYAVNHAKVNWDKQALNFAKFSYHNKYEPTNRKKTYGMLTTKSSGDVTVGGFTKSQADYAMKHLK